MLCCGAAWLFLHTPFIPAASFLLYPTSCIFCCGSLGQGFCPYTVVIHDMHENREMTSIRSRMIDAFFLLFCPVSFSVVGEDCGCVLWQRSENIRRLPDVGYLHLLLIASSKPNRKAGGFRRIPPAPRGAAESGGS